jgi:hypothetical protein
MAAHMFRHTAGTNVVAASGGDLKLAAEQLGHSNIQTTAGFYTHTDTQRRLMSAEILSEPLKGPGNSVRGKGAHKPQTIPCNSHTN